MSVFERGFEVVDDWEDPLAVPVGLWDKETIGEPIPDPTGWPESFKPDIVERVLGYLPKD